MPVSVAGRTELVRKWCAQRAIGALIVVDTTDIRWLTGFWGSAGTLVVGRDSSTLIVDGRYAAQARQQIEISDGDSHVLEARTSDGVFHELQRLLTGISRLGLHLERVNAALYERLRSAFPGAEFTDVTAVSAFRRIKTEPEIERIEQACAATDKALAAVSPILETVEDAVVTERDIRDELEYRMRQFGADGPSYETIVASGENSSHPHHRPTSRRITDGDSVVIDVGARVDGFHSDMTRTFLIGKVDQKLRRMYETVARVQELAVQAVRAGVTGSAVDAICRAEFAQDVEYFLHGTGHGVGLEIHEAPWLRSGWDHELNSSEVVTVEPGLYRVGVGGVRIEDLVVVEPTGCRILTLSPKEPLCLQ